MIAAHGRTGRVPMIGNHADMEKAMTGWNMPPGCNVSDIPGNRREDLIEEAFWDTLYAKAAELGIDSDTDAFEKFGAFVWELVGNAFGDGYQNGVADADMAKELQDGRR